MERNSALVADGGGAAFLKFQLMFDSMGLQVKELCSRLTLSEGWTWMCDAMNDMARVDKNPGMVCSFDKFHERPCRGSALPHMIPERHKVKLAVKSEPKGEPCFNLTSGDSHGSDCLKVMMSP